MQAMGMYVEQHMKLRLEQGWGFHDEYLEIRDGKVFVLFTYKKYQHASNRFMDSKLIAYHMRLGKQAGNLRARPAKTEFALQLHKVVQNTSHLLPTA